MPAMTGWTSPSLHAALVGDVVAHRVALQVVAVVDEQGVGRLGADRLDDRGGAGEAEGVGRLVGVVVVGLDVAVQVGGREDAQVRLAGLGAGGEGMQQHEPAERGAGAEKARRGRCAWAAPARAGRRDDGTRAAEARPGASPATPPQSRWTRTRDGTRRVGRSGGGPALPGTGSFDAAVSEVAIRSCSCGRSRERGLLPRAARVAVDLQARRVYGASARRGVPASALCRQRIRRARRAGGHADRGHHRGFRRAAVFEEFEIRGVAFAQAPSRQTWGGTDFHVLDPDGNIISFVSFG